MHLFEVCGHLGRGGAGEALLAEGPDGICALKCVQLAGLEAVQRRSAIREVHLLRRLEHPNVMQIRNAFVHHQHLILACEFCDAGDLEGLISRRREAMSCSDEGVLSNGCGNFNGFSENTVLGVFAQVARALEYIHKQSIVHGDLKSSNIMLTKRGVAKVGDFGLAASHGFASTIQALHSGKGAPDQSTPVLGEFVGSIYYMPPEVCDGHARTTAGDCWALGVVLYEMCTLNLPFMGSNLLAVTLQISQGSFSPLPTSYSQELRDLCGSLLNLDAQQRLTAAEVTDQSVVRSVWKMRPAGKAPSSTPPSAPGCRAEVLKRLAEQQPLSKLYGPSEYERFVLHQFENAD